MVKLIFAILDSKTGSFSEVPIFQFLSFGDAKRSFSDLVNDKKSDSKISLHPEDFSLVYLGEYNYSTGIFTNAKIQENLGNGTSFLVSNGLKVV